MPPLPDQGRKHEDVFVEMLPWRGGRERNEAGVNDVERTNGDW